MKLDPNKTALLTLDLQKGILELNSAGEAILQNAAKAVEFARKNQFLLIHIGMGFSEGYPELPDNEFGQRIRKNRFFLKSSTSSEFHSAVYQQNDLIVYKQRVGAFSENQLNLILRSRGIEDLVFFGVSTSGVVLSTIRRAFDLDYRCTVIKDACFDADEEVHRVLTEKIFPRQAAVFSVEEFIAEQEKY